MREKKKKGWFLKHAKSSAAVISLIIHAALILAAISFVAVSVIQKEEPNFEARRVDRPRQRLKKLQVPVKMKKSTPKPKLRKRLVVQKVQRKIPEFRMPEIAGIKGGMAAGDGAGDMGSIGFFMPEIDFFGAKTRGEKVVFVVHFGPATIHHYSGEERRKNQAQIEYNNPFTRMTGLTLRNRLEDLVNGLPEYTLFNVIAYFFSEASAINPQMMLATPGNKQKLREWMESVNPLEGDYEHCLHFGNARGRINAAKKSWPKRVDNLPFYSLKWAYPYEVSALMKKKYVPDAPKGLVHWARGVAWAILKQKPDTIFILTTNYIDGWKKDQPKKMTDALKKMCFDVYGPDKKKWPTINVVVLTPAGRDSTGAYNTLNVQFGPIVKSFRGTRSVIDDIKKYMNDEERDLYRKYKAEYGNR